MSCHQVAVPLRALNVENGAVLPKLSAIPGTRARKHVIDMPKNAYMPASLVAKASHTVVASVHDANMLDRCTNTPCMPKAELLRCTHEHEQASSENLWHPSTVTAPQDQVHTEEQDIDATITDVDGNESIHLAKKLRTTLSVLQSTRLSRHAQASQRPSPAYANANDKSYRH